jgi:hypothetical protein
MDGLKITAIDNATVAHKQKIEKLQESHDIRKLDQYEEQSNNAKQEKQIKAQEESVAVSTLQYAYNQATDDLIIKIRNPDGSIGQYPTESMIKLKALLKEDFINKQ